MTVCVCVSIRRGAYVPISPGSGTVVTLTTTRTTSAAQASGRHVQPVQHALEGGRRVLSCTLHANDAMPIKNKVEEVEREVKVDQTR